MTAGSVSLPAEVEAELAPLSWRDIDTLSELELQLFGDDAWSSATWWSELAMRPRRDYVVARSGSRIAGYAGLDLAGETADVMTVAVAEAFQGKGVGGLLMRWLTGRAREAGAGHLMLEVRADNVAARKLYEQNDFRLVTVRRRYYQPGDVDALVMRRRLGEPS